MDGTKENSIYKGQLGRHFSSGQDKLLLGAKPTKEQGADWKVGERRRFWEIVKLKAKGEFPVTNLTLGGNANIAGIVGRGFWSSSPNRVKVRELTII